VRATLKESIDFLKAVDIWHEFKYSDQQIMTVAPELQTFGKNVLDKVLDLVKTMDRKPTPAKIKSLCKEQQSIIKQNNQLERSYEESPDTWMSSQEYARSQGFDSFKNLVKSKIVEESSPLDAGGLALSSASSTIKKDVFWDELGEEE
tara:strand:+ start:848 stop:1291 length:444 start_codon:yes stop_codon:yes gene_type:complete